MACESLLQGLIPGVVLPPRPNPPVITVGMPPAHILLLSTLRIRSYKCWTRIPRLSICSVFSATEHKACVHV